MDEVKEVIRMPRFDSKKVADNSSQFKSLEVDDAVIKNLGEYVAGIATMYR